MSITILALGEIVGKPGVYAVKTGIKQLRKEHNIDLVIANGEGATGGFGIGKNHAIYLHKVGVDVLTTGEKTYFKKDMVDHIAKAPYILRPANYPAKNPGRGWRTFDAGDKSVAVVTLLGQSEFSRVHLGNPFSLLPILLEKIRTFTPYIVLQYHAATTAERKTMFFYADGMLSAVVGTHSKAITADAEIFPKGTAVITDNGRCGSLMSVGGLEPELEIRKFMTQIPERSNDCWDSLELQGALITLGDNGKAESITALRVPVATPEKER
ncbi:MAG: TIGR00282 family metallophosphoesterase [Spirochaetales bacterium]|jgi:metallophosphoesterase (TIGR00282 family)|nr:TIGR00282 family metallophosphoesterase [Spirochaetales bacterium]